MKKIHQKDQRKRLFINKEIQGTVIWRCAVFWVIYHFFMLHTLFAFEFMAYLVQLMNGAPAQTFSEIYSTFIGKYYPICLTALAILPLLAFDVLKMSHRIVGPLIPFQRAIKNLKNGTHVDPIKLRKGDLLTEFQNDFNDFLLWYQAERPHVPIDQNGDDEEMNSIEESMLADVQSLHETVSTDSQLPNIEAVKTEQIS